MRNVHILLEFTTPCPGYIFAYFSPGRARTYIFSFVHKYQFPQVSRLNDVLNGWHLKYWQNNEH